MCRPIVCWAAASAELHCPSHSSIIVCCLVKISGWLQSQEKDNAAKNSFIGKTDADKTKENAKVSFQGKTPLLHARWVWGCCMFQSALSLQMYKYVSRIQLPIQKYYQRYVFYAKPTKYVWRLPWSWSCKVSHYIQYPHQPWHLPPSWTWASSPSFLSPSFSHQHCESTGGCTIAWLTKVNHRCPLGTRHRCPRCPPGTRPARHINIILIAASLERVNNVIFDSLVKNN